MKDLNLLWKLLNIESVYQDDQAVCYAILKDIISLPALETHITSMEELTTFFLKTICDPSNKLQYIPIEGVQAIEILLFQVNRSLGHFGEKVRARQTRFQNAVGGMPQPREPSKHDRFGEVVDYVIKVPPSKIQGISILWRIMLEAKNEEASSRAIELLNMLYTKIAKELEGELADISTDFVETAIKKLKLFYEIIRKEKEGRNREIVKLLRLIEEMMDESEKRGNGGITPLIGLTKGSPLNFTIINAAVESHIAGGIPDKFDLHVHSKITLWQLKMLIGNRIQLAPEMVFTFFLNC